MQHEDMPRLNMTVCVIGVLVLALSFDLNGSAQTTDKAEIVYAASDVVWPKVIHREEPKYSEPALSAGLQGNILIAATIDVSGVASDPIILSPLEHGLNEQALMCLSNWRFQPATKNGKPVAFRATVEINFRISQRHFDDRAEERRAAETAVATLLSRQENGKLSTDSVGIIRSLAGLGSESAAFVVGLWQINGDVLPKDDATGLTSIRRAAEKGYPPAMVFIGDALIDGKGMHQDIKRGSAYLRKAVAAGSIDAEQDLGKRFVNGEGLNANANEGRKYLRLCSQAGRVECQTLIDQLAK